MHESARILGKCILENYRHVPYKRILDIGSFDVNGSLREFCPEGSEYIGIDLGEGPGVDIVLADPYKYPFPDRHFDLVVSTSCFEHDPMFWLTFLEGCRVLAEGGIFYINAPSNGPFHQWPWDNWRFYPDSAIALQMWARRSGLDISVVESFTMTPSEGWNDCVMTFTKGDTSRFEFKYLSDSMSDVVNIRKGVGSKLERFTEVWRPD